MMRATLAALLALTTVAAAQEVPEHNYPAGSIMLGAGYQQTSDRAHFGGLSRIGAAELRSRLLFGHSVAWCTGFDGELGGGSSGLVYQAEAYLVGLAFRFHGDDVISLCGGAGLGGIHDAVPFAWQFPVEASAELQLGPIRALALVKATWVAGAAARKHGSDLGADEASASFAVRLGPNLRYWGQMRAGSGPYVGVTVRRLLGSSLLGAVLGLDFWGGE